MLGLIDKSTEIDSFYIANVGHRKNNNIKQTLNLMNLVFTVHVLGYKQQTFIQTKAECHDLIIQSFEIYEHTSFILSFD